MDSFDYYTLTARAADHQRELQQSAAAEALASQQDEPLWHRQALARLGDVLIAGGERLKAAADVEVPVYNLNPNR
jgi:hypothetical protein